MSDKYRNGVLDNIIGESGIQVAVKIAPTTIPILVLSVVAAIIIGSIGSHYILKAINK
jgi:hypothetical protein